MDCWEFLHCAIETRERCPAYPDKGVECWKVTGTKCDQGRHEKETLAEKIKHCRKCDFYVKHADKY